MRTTTLAQLLSEGRVWQGAGQACPSLSALQDSNSSSPLATLGIREIDAALLEGGLAFGAVHECCFESEVGSQEKKLWYAPTFFLSALLGETFRRVCFHEQQIVAWVGRRIWPTPHILSTLTPADSWSWEKQAVLLKPASKEKRLWSAIQLLRSPATLAVIVDAHGFHLPATRRIQLAARKNNALCLLVRPPWEMALPSTAISKWQIRPVDSENAALRWKVKLLSAKSLPAPLEWDVEWQEERENETPALALVQPRSFSGDEPHRAQREA
jgi:hypothetical protein